MKETNISPEVRFVTAVTASGSINFCQTCKFLHFYYKFVCVLSPKLLKFGEIKGVKFLSRKSGGVNFLTNLMSVLADGNLILGAGIWPTYFLEWPWALNRNPFMVGKPTETNIAVFFNIVQKGEWGWGALMVFFLTFPCSQATLPPFVRAPLENMAFLTNLSIPWPKGKVFLPWKVVSNVPNIYLGIRQSYWNSQTSIHYGTQKNKTSLVEVSNHESIWELAYLNNIKRRLNWSFSASWAHFPPHAWYQLWLP